MDLSFLGVFAAGLVTFLSPCILPLVPVYLAVLSGASSAELQAGRRAARVMLAALAFGLGLATVFVLLGMAATAVGRALVVHRTLFMQLGGLAVFLFGLKFLGLLHAPWLDRQVRPDPIRPAGGSLAGAFLFGAAFALGWTPCVGPVLGSVLTFTAVATTRPLMGALYLGTYAAGLVLPLLAVAAVAPLALRFIKRIHAWMRPMQLATGGVLSLVGVLLITDSLGALTPAFAAEAPAARAAAAARTPAEVKAASPAAAAEALPGSENAACETASEGACGLPEVEAMGSAQALPQGPALVEFVSKSCPICLRMVPVVAAAKKDCAGHGVQVVTVEVDRPEGRELARQRGVLGVPTYLFLNASGREVARLVGEQPHSALAQSLEVLSGGKCKAFRAFPN